MTRRRIKPHEVREAQNLARWPDELPTLREELERLDHNPEDFAEEDPDDDC